MKDGQTYHEFNCSCGFCKMGDTRHPDHSLLNDNGELICNQICQATFKEHCQYPKCDCDRPVTAAVINSTDFPRDKRLAELEEKLAGPLCVKGMTKETCPYNPKLGCDCGANAAYTEKMYPDNGDFYVTNPAHGGKVTCYKCNGFITEREHQGYWADDQDKTEFPMDSFHKDCYNPYEHYYGLDKPID